MKRDPALVEALLVAFIDYPKAAPTLPDLAEANPQLDPDDQGVRYHLLMLHDAGLIVGPRGGSIGITEDDDGELFMNVVTLRLTSAGQDFAGQLRGPPEVVQKVRRTIVESGVAVAVQVAAALLTQAAGVGS